MHALPTDWSALCALCLLLGLRHGFDADHLATIDGFTRFNAARREACAPWCGTLFSLGHGAVVLCFAALVALLGRHWQLPRWLEPLGAAVSIALLVLVGVLNLRAVLAARADEVLAPAGFKGRWVGRLVRRSGPLVVAAVGGLFALSLDTASQAALFTLAGLQYGGTGHALGLAALFGAGMVFTDTASGWWISRLVARADQLAVVASRVMGLAVAGVSLLVAGLAAARWLLPQVDLLPEGHGLAPGLLVCVLMLSSYACARWLARARADDAAGAAEATGG
jgi:nickel/cobalt transporter (NiCoT) family protein